MKIAITTPAEIMPDKIPGLECECQNRPVDLSREPVFITWLKRKEDPVVEGEPLLEGECQKRLITLTAPCSGILAEILIEDGTEVKQGVILGYIERYEAGTKDT